MGNTAGALGAVLAMLTLAVVLFLVFRFIVLWYWRVNEAVALLKSIDEKLGRMLPRERHGIENDVRLGDIDSLPISRE
jgi:hypothetical protein